MRFERTLAAEIHPHSDQRFGMLISLSIISVGLGESLYKLTELRNMLCGIHVFLDNDTSGRSAAEKAQADGLLKPIDLHLATCPGKRDSEWEDLVAVDLYKDRVNATFGADLKGADVSEFRSLVRSDGRHVSPLREVVDGQKQAGGEGAHRGVD